MVESEVAALIAPWLTPTSLFVLLNIVLATIFLANKGNNNHYSSMNHDNNSTSNQYGYQNLQHQDSYEGPSLVPPPPQLVRAPSLFSRVASFNFSNIYYSEVQAPPSSDAPDHSSAATVTRAPSLLYRVTSFNFCRAPQQAGAEKRKEEEEARDVSVSHVKTQDQQGAVKVKKMKNKKVKKEVTEVKEENQMVKKEAVEVVKETAEASRRGDQEVDSKADDFINKFKQQLKMQRLESLLRYRNSTDN